jgi:hypothetical protein
MSPREARRRGVNQDDEVGNLYQGANPVEAARRGEVYPGDQCIRPAQGMTVQIHILTIQRDGRDVMTSVPTVAVWVPQEMGRVWVVQEPRR